MNVTKILFISLIIIIGALGRFSIFQSNFHPNNDEFYELKKLQEARVPGILNKTSEYGDHTSYPGEFLTHYFSLAFLDLFEHPAIIELEKDRIEGLTKKSMWILAIPKILLWVVSICLFYFICMYHITTVVGMCSAFAVLLFNAQLVQHAFELRPYGILSELAIINIFLSQRNNKQWVTILHGFVIVFTCIYHAYGILIAFLPMIMYHKKRSDEFIGFVAAAIFGWMYYASYSNFGMSPNHAQSLPGVFSVFRPDQLFSVFIYSYFEGIMSFGMGVLFLTWAAMNFDKKKLIFLLGLVILPLIMIVLVDIKTTYIIHPRQWIWTIPAMAVWCGQIVENGTKGMKSVS